MKGKKQKIGGSGFIALATILTFASEGSSLLSKGDILFSQRPPGTHL